MNSHFAVKTIVRSLVSALCVLALGLVCAPAPHAFATKLGDIYFKTGSSDYRDYYEYWYQGHLTYNATDQTWEAGDDHFEILIEDVLKVLVDPGTKVYKQVDGRCYDYDDWTNGWHDESSLHALWYPSGELIVQAGDWERADRIVDGCHATLRFKGAPGSGAKWENVVKRSTEQVTIDASLLASDDANALNMASWFKGFGELLTVNGLSTEEVCPTSLPHTFDGCAHLETLDLSGLDTSRCANFESMFDDCSLLDTLVLGQGWTQVYAREKNAAQATFPVDMRCVETQQLYAEGDIIPDGAGTYKTTRTPITSATITLLDSASGQELTGPIEYTGAAIEPTARVRLGEQLLEQGTDFEVSYKNNVENGTATVTVKGKRHEDGTGYTGTVSTTFEIADTACYANLYANGTLVLQATHVPIPGVAGSGAGAPKMNRWFTLSDNSQSAQVPWSASRGKVKRVVVDKSFAQFKPASLQGWFAGCTALESIEGLQYLDTSQATSAAGMFAGCASLPALDLSGFDALGISDFEGFLDGCTSLASLTGGAWGASAAPLFPHEMLCEAQGWKRYSAGEAIPPSVPACTRGITLRWAKVAVDKTSFPCTEKPIELDLSVTIGDTELVEGTDYVVTYKNNVWPGKATATIEARGAFTGGLVVPFEIIDTYVHVGDRLVYRTKNAVFTFRVLTVRNANGVTVAATTALERIEVANKQIATVVIPSECTVGGVNVSVTQIGSKLKGRFGNVSCVVIGPKVVVIGAKAFANAKKVTKLKVKSARLSKVTNCLKSSKVKRVTVKVKLAKKRQKTYKKWFTKKAGKKGVKYTYAG